MTNQDFSKFIKKFNNSPYLGLKSKQVYNEPTKAYLFLIKYITKLMKIQRHIRIRTKNFKSIVNKTIRHAIETIVHINKAVQSVELEGNNTTTACADKYKQTYIAYDIVVEENTSSTSENKEKARDGYVRIY